MSRFSSPLNNVRVAAPCSADWDLMIGNELSRFCGHCNLNVYNLSGMTRSEAEHLIANNEGRLCVRFYRRADGSILTKNCPVGLREIQRRVSKFTRAIASAVLTFFAGIGIYESSKRVAHAFEPHVVGVLAMERPNSVTGYPPVTEPTLIGRAQMGGVSVGRMVRITPTKKKATRRGH